MAEADVVLDRPGWTRTVDGKRVRVPGTSLTPRLIVVEVRDSSGRRLARCLLLSNATDAASEQLADGCCWRGRIESFHKRIKSAGRRVEHWLQESAAAIAKRLLVGAVACVLARRIEREPASEAKACRRFLVRRSGRRTKRLRPIATPALPAGPHLLFTMLDVLEHYTPEQLRRFAQIAAPDLHRSDADA